MKIKSPLLTQSFDLDESAAGTFTELEIETNSVPEAGVGILIVGVDFITDMPRDLGTDITSDVCLTDDQKTAMPEMDDEDVLAFQRVVTREAAANGWQVLKIQDGGYSGKLVETPQFGFATLARRLYGYIDTANTGVVATSDLRIYYFVVQMTTEEATRRAIAEAYN